jgi:hypothetical protein
MYSERLKEPNNKIVYIINLPFCLIFQPYMPELCCLKTVEKVCSIVEYKLTDDIWVSECNKKHYVKLKCPYAYALFRKG